MGLVSLVLLSQSPGVTAQTPLGYQGRILVGGSPHNGNGYFKFALVSTGATETLWSNDGTGLGTPGGQPGSAVQLTVSNGLYRALLGSAPMTTVPTDVFSNHDDVHLRVWFGTAPAGPFELLSPDQRLTAVGYALNAKKAASLVPSYDVGDSKTLNLQTIAGGDLTFDVTFTEPFPTVASLELEAGWTLDSVTESGFTATANFVSSAVDTAGAVGTDTSLAMINGRPAISYRDLSESSLKFARAGDALGTEWPPSSVVTVDGIITDSGEYTSLAQVAGRPAISYYHAASGDLRFVRAANPEGSSWPSSNVVRVDGETENVGWHTSLAVVGGVPAISYYAPNAGELRYAWASDAEGTTWPASNMVVVDGSGAPDRGRHSSLIELGGKPAIAYHDATTADLVFAYLSGPDPAVPANWTKITIDSADAVGEFASLAIVDGVPAIAYYDSTNGNLKFTRASNAAGSAWPPGNIVVADGSPADTGQFASLAVISGRPAIGYHDATNGNLNFVWASDAQGTAWPAGNIVMVAGASSQMGSHTSMAEVNGVPGIAFHDSVPALDLRFASLPSANWTASTGDALPVLASGVKSGAITSQMLAPGVGVWQTSGNNLVYNTGKVGIGRVPATNALEVEGSASKTVAGNWAANSDRRIKEDIQPVGNALGTLQGIRLVSFRYNQDYRAQHPSIADQRYLNVIAQEFAKVFPEHVRPSGELLPDGSEILQVDTYPLTIYAAAAVQELNAKLTDTQSELSDTQSELAAMKDRLAELEKIVLKNTK